MKTTIIKMDEDHINYKEITQAGEIIRQGGLVAFPTETVYGLGADAFNAKAAQKIYAAKGRPSDNPLIIHICYMQDLDQIAAHVPEQAKLLARAFWPGPLTMIFKKQEGVPDEITGGMDTVAVRMPSNEIALALIRAGGGFIAAPSANTSGRPSPTNASHVYEDLQGRIPLILDGGQVGIGIESTIIDLTQKVPMVLRPGYITMKMLTDIIGDVTCDSGLFTEASIHNSLQNSMQKPKAPGMKYKHYAPKAQMVLVEGDTSLVVSKIKELAKQAVLEGKQVGIIGTKETVHCYEQGLALSVGERQDEETIAHNLYRILREFDKSDVDIIYAECFFEMQMGSAIMNRMLKASGHQIIQVT